eukprot:c26390_g1_i1 orf=701-895(-)
MSLKCIQPLANHQVSPIGPISYSLVSIYAYLHCTFLLHQCTPHSHQSTHPQLHKFASSPLKATS